MHYKIYRFVRDIKQHMVNNRLVPNLRQKRVDNGLQGYIAGRNRTLSHHRDIDNCKDGIIPELDGNDNVRKS